MLSHPPPLPPQRSNSTSDEIAGLWPTSLEPRYNSYPGYTQYPTSSDFPTPELLKRWPVIFITRIFLLPYKLLLRVGCTSVIDSHGSSEESTGFYGGRGGGQGARADKHR